MTTDRLPLLVFSDLDGTLLDHGDYSWAAAIPGLDRVRALGGGLVLASSKTAPEIALLRDAIGFTKQPMIVENGAGIVWPGESANLSAALYNDIRAKLQDLPAGFRGFGDMSVKEVMAQTGLTAQAAALAKQRSFSEPGLWTGTQEALDLFLAAAAAEGLAARSGGRFLTLSFGRTKADAMAEVVQELSPERTIALGDAPNDVEMIEAADHGVIIANPHGKPIPTLAGEQRKQIIRTKAIGPSGWSEALLQLTAI